MKTILVLVLALGACSKGSGFSAKAKDYADKICACKDAECARPLYVEFLDALGKRTDEETHQPANPDVGRLVSCAKANGAM